MWLTRVLNIVRINEPIIKKHTNEYTGVQVGMKMTTDKAWTRRRIKMMTAHIYGRSKFIDQLYTQYFWTRASRPIKYVFFCCCCSCSWGHFSK